MELLNVIAARSTWLFDINDLNPKGKDVAGDLIDWLKDNYHFIAAPSSATDVDTDTKGFIFKQGSFQARDEIFVSVDLSVYNDGLVASTHSSTRDTETFLEDVLTTAAKEFSLYYRPSIVRKKIPLSEVTVRLDEPLARLNPGLAEFARKIAQLSPRQADFELGGVSFWTDNSHSSLKLSAFSIERKIDAPFSENRFYSKASLHTDDHLRLITEFEQLLANAGQRIQ